MGKDKNQKKNSKSIPWQGIGIIIGILGLLWVFGEYSKMSKKVTEYEIKCDPSWYDKYYRIQWRLKEIDDQLTAVQKTNKYFTDKYGTIPERIEKDSISYFWLNPNWAQMNTDNMHSDSITVGLEEWSRLYPLNRSNREIQTLISQELLNIKDTTFIDVWGEFYNSDSIN